MRLSEGANATYGAVQVYHNNSWRLVCSDGWDNAIATKVCREMGLADGTLVPRSGFSVNVSDTMMFATCSDSDAKLSDCRLSALPSSACASGFFASVFCRDANETQSPSKIFTLCFCHFVTQKGCISENLLQEKHRSPFCG